jgi:uncharacterized protein (DUF111 family)
MRHPHEVPTRWGPVAGKISYVPDGSRRFSPEYEACRQIAERNLVSLGEVIAEAQNAFQRSNDA